MTVNTRMVKPSLESGLGPQTEGYVISEAARLCGLSVHQVRTYLDMRLVYACGTTQGGFRLFDDGCLERLKLICSCREAGLGLPEITDFIHALDTGDEQQCRAAKRQMHYTIAVKRAALHRCTQVLTKAASRTGGSALIRP
ncbi:MerR family transcriptional regulator [Marinobacter sp. ELB17]|uniref:MerR family transcriptional regulator n=1 Tax=Marinobacter sp. ELB17 TaxID=270374 RepID=UPI0000F3B58E|nr:MerR family transcriptional regulator [Marinobacter sp. ELB17]EAZ97511.1 MerD [Marinobacter sp. ELB17]